MTWFIGLGAPLCAIAAGWVYKANVPSAVGTTILKDVANVTGEFNFAHIKRLGRDFWILFCVIFFYFGALFAFMADGIMLLEVL